MATSVTQRTQFSLTTLFLSLTFVASVMSLLRAPDGIAVPLLIAATVASPTLLLIAIIYGAEFARTFSIGALVPAVLSLYAMRDMIPFSTDGDWVSAFVPYRTMMGIPLMASAVLGYLSVGLRWLLERTAAEPSGASNPPDAD